MELRWKGRTYTVKVEKESDGRYTVVATRVETFADGTDRTGTITYVGGKSAPEKNVITERDLKRLGYTPATLSGRGWN